MRSAQPVTLTAQQESALSALLRARKTPQRIVERIRIVMRCAKGHADSDIADELGCGKNTPARWRARFLANGIDGLTRDAPRPGRPAVVREAKTAEIVRLTTQKTPEGRTHWSTRTMAAAVGVSEKTVRRVWHAHGLKPHLSRTFKLSNDPHFEDKVRDIVGLYLSPPAHAVVLSADEKSQIQALERSQPMLPFNAGHVATRTHDYARHGTTTLFAALDVATGEVIGECHPRHTHKEWLRFLKLIDRSIPVRLAIHLICDNFSTHKHPRVKAWLERHPRFHV